MQGSQKLENITIVFLTLLITSAAATFWYGIAKYGFTSADYYAWYKDWVSLKNCLSNSVWRECGKDVSKFPAGYLINSALANQDPRRIFTINFLVLLLSVFFTILS
ncbi:MAG: hypothetical protein NZM26_02795 [Patescibacteria group bacterium]|nr:hypothetical protein [Patescibacteria group bacterium]